MMEVNELMLRDVSGLVWFSEGSTSYYMVVGIMFGYCTYCRNNSTVLLIEFTTYNQIIIIVLRFQH